MCSLQKYLPCCTGYDACRQHYPPGIYALPPKSSGESPPEKPKSRSRFTRKLSKAVKFIRRREAPKSDRPPNQSVGDSGILSLPVELLRHIGFFLPLSSAAAFALSSRHICRAIGPQSWAELQKAENKNDKLAFLALIKKDDDSWVCEDCQMIHHRNFDSRKFLRTDDSLEYPFGYRLPSRLVQLAIERKQKGPKYGICPDRLSCAGIFKKPGLQLDYAYRVRVVDGDLILRMDVRIRLEKGGDCRVTPLLGLCPHRRPTPYLMIDPFEEPPYHCRADYPYIPQDIEGSSTDPDPQLLSGLFGSWSSSWSCMRCFCVTRMVTDAVLHDKWTESLCRSYQNVGSGCRKVSQRGVLFENVELKSRKLFEDQ